jgi:limonene-1,2-epoxide hydrolase
MDHAHLEVLNLAAAGNLVMTERVDHFSYDGRKVDARVMGAFEVVGDKIAAWRDYYDVP